MSRRRMHEIDETRFRHPAGEDTTTPEIDQAPVSGPVPMHVPGDLLADPRLAARGNSAVRAALARQVQRQRGNRALQRALAPAPSQADPIPAPPDRAGDPAYLQQRASLETLHTQVDNEAATLEQARDPHWLATRHFAQLIDSLLLDSDQGAYHHPQGTMQSVLHLHAQMTAEQPGRRQQLVDKVRAVAGGWSWAQIFNRWEPPDGAAPTPGSFAAALQGVLAAPSGPLGDPTTLAHTLLVDERQTVEQALPGAADTVAKAGAAATPAAPDVLQQDQQQMQRSGGPLDQTVEKIEANELSRLRQKLPLTLAQIILDTADLRDPAWQAYTVRFSGARGARGAASPAASPAAGAGNSDNKGAAGKTSN